MKKVNFRHFFIFFGQTFNVFTFASLRWLFRGKAGTFWTIFSRAESTFLDQFCEKIVIWGKKRLIPVLLLFCPLILLFLHVFSQNWSRKVLLALEKKSKIFQIPPKQSSQTCKTLHIEGLTKKYEKRTKIDFKKKKSQNYVTDFPKIWGGGLINLLSICEDILFLHIIFMKRKTIFNRIDKYLLKKICIFFFA